MIRDKERLLKLGSLSQHPGRCITDLGLQRAIP